MRILDKISVEGELSLGLVFPLESYSGSVPEMNDQEELAQLAEKLGFKSLWFRDVPFHDPSFGDAGQMYDPFIYMTHIMNHTDQIALATGSIILPLRHPVHSLKSIHSLQKLSDGRIIIGCASGDRPIEYPAFEKDIEIRSELFRDSFSYMKALDQDFPNHTSTHYGSINGMVDLLPKSAYKTPYLITGHSGQSLDWIAENGDGWLYYPRGMHMLKMYMEDWNTAVAKAGHKWKPFMQSLYIDLLDDDTLEPTPIHLGFRCSVNFLIKYLEEIKLIGVNHVIINLKFNSNAIDKTIALLGERIIPYFNH